MVGKRIGQYRVVDRLGNGGMGAVYQAVDELLDRPVALKILEADIDGSTTRFRAEASALARLSHPGIATLYELIEHEGRLVMVMELVKGQTLHQVVEQIGVLTPQRAGELCMQVLDALAHAHGAGVVHRDLKPGNLMLTADGKIKILDFGIARVDGAVHLTRAGAMMGTPAYMAPEQVMGTAIDCRADLYALGVVFYRLITGVLPFSAATPFEMAQSQVNDEPTPVNLVRPELPAWAGEIIARALAKVPGDRFQSATEFHEALSRSLGTLTRVPETAVAEPTEVLERPPMSPKPALEKPRRRALTWALPVAAVVLVGAIVATMVQAGGAPVQVAHLPIVDETAATTSVSGADAVPPAAVIAADLRQPSATARNVPASPRTESATGESAPPALFKNVKWLAVTGSSTSARDATVTFAGSEVTAVPVGSDNPLSTMSYKQISKATYVHAKDPAWSPAFAGPAGKLDVPGILGRSRHWLVLQTADSYAIFRLDGDNRAELLKEFESRTGLTIERPAKDR